MARLEVPGLTGKLSALIDFADPRQPDGPRLRRTFGAPREVLVAHRMEEVREVLDAAQAAARRGAWCIGYLRYEAAGAFDAALAVHPAEGPLAWFAVHEGESRLACKPGGRRLGRRLRLA